MNHLCNSKRFTLFTKSVIITLLCLLMQACVKHTYKAEPVNTVSLLNEINSWSINDPGLNTFLKKNGVSVEMLNTKVFNIRRLYLTGLYYDPDMKVAYKKWKKAQVAVSQNNYLLNPEISIPFEHHSETSGGNSEWTIGAVLSFIYERKGKREARQSKAEIEMFNAELEMQLLALESYRKFEKKYYDYVAAFTKVIEIENEIDILNTLVDQLQKKYELGAVSHFEVSTVNLDLQHRSFELSIQKNSAQEIRDDLLTMTHVNHNEIENIEIENTSLYSFTKEIFQQTSLFSSDFSSLQKSMVETNLELAIRLNNYALSEADLKLEIEKQYPDIVLSPGFIFDQSDNIWALGASWVLPLFDNSKQNLDILRSLQERQVKQQEIIVLQEKLLNLLYKADKSVLRHKETIEVSDEIMKSIEKRAEEIKTQIEIGGVDNVVLLRNRMEFFKAKQTQVDIYSDALHAMLNMEYFMKNTRADINIEHVVALWLENIDGKNSNESVN